MKWGTTASPQVRREEDTHRKLSVNRAPQTRARATDHPRPHLEPTLGESRALPVKVVERLTARTRARNGHAQRRSGDPAPREDPQRDLFGAVLRTRVKQGYLTVPRPPPERRSWCAEEGEVSMPPPTPPPARKWFAPDILIGSSLPFERRAARLPGDCLTLVPRRAWGLSSPAPSRWPRVLPAAAVAPGASLLNLDFLLVPSWTRHHLGSRGWFLVPTL